MKTRRYAIAGVAVLAMIASACQANVKMFARCSPAADGNPTGTDGDYVLLCDNGIWKPIMTVNEYIQIRQGQQVTIAPVPTQPTTTTTTTTTTPPAPKILVRAHTNVDGIVGYHPVNNDVLIAEIVDTNRDDVVSPGDTIRTNKFPKAVRTPADFGSFTKKSHTIARVDPDSNSFGVYVTDADGNEFTWIDIPIGELYSENDVDDVDGDTATTVFDTFEAGETDFVIATATSPSGPDDDGGIGVVDAGGASNRFIDVDIRV